MHFNPSTSLLKIVIEMIYIDVQMCIHSMQGLSLFKVVLLCDVTSNTMLFLLKSKGTAIYYIFFSKPKKKKKVTVSGRSQELIEKPHLKRKKNKWQHQNFCSWSQNWFYATFFPLFFVLFLVYRLSLILVGWVGADAFKQISLQALNSVPIQWFCFYTPLWRCRAKDLSNMGESWGPSICHPTALTKPHQDFWCMFEPFCKFAALWLKAVSWRVKSKRIRDDESHT